MGRPRLEDPTNGLITIAVNRRDRAALEARAEAAGLSLSRYIRNAALGSRAPANPNLNFERLRDLTHVAADQGRLRGLLKMWLASRPDVGAPVHDVRRVLREIEQLQRKLAELAGQI